MCRSRNTVDAQPERLHREPDAERCLEDSVADGIWEPALLHVFQTERMGTLLTRSVSAYRVAL